MASLPFQELQKRFKNIPSACKKIKNLTKTVTNMGTKSNFKHIHYTMFCGADHGALNNSILEALRFSKPPKGGNSRSTNYYYERCKSIVDDIDDGLDEFIKFWIPWGGKDFVTRKVFEQAAGMRVDGCTIIPMGCPDCAYQQAGRRGPDAQIYLDYFNLYYNQAQLLHPIVHALKDALSRLR